MKLHILRHAETDDFSETGKDIDRRLLPMGINQATALRSYFAKIQEIETVWCSEGSRAKQTCEIVLSESHPKPNFDLDLYLASQQTILQKIWSFESSNDLLIIGHNFGISDLINYFTEENLELQTAEYVCIEFNCDSWIETSIGTGTILDRHRPLVSS